MCSKMTKAQVVETAAEYSKVIEIINKYGKSKEQLLSILLDIQADSPNSYVDEVWAEIVAEELGLPLAKVYDVLTFYAMFSIKPRGKYVIEICKSTPCYVTKADAVAAMFEKELGVKIGETTEDQLFTLLYTSCVGACDVGPVAKIGEEVYGNLTEGKVADIVNSYKKGAAQCPKH